MSLLERNPRSTARLVALAVIAVTLSFAPAASAATFIVNSTDDNTDGSCDGTHCTLREAVEAANGSPGLDEIAFAIPGPAPQTITVGRAGLGGLGITDPVEIVAVSFDGTGAPTSVPPVEVLGVGDGVTGFAFYAGSSGSRISGLAIGNFGTGVYSETGGLEVSGNHIGLNAAGNTAVGNSYGVYDGSSAGGVLVSANVISGNAGDGVVLQGSGNRVVRNRIGTNLAGTQAIPNSTGVRVYSASGAAQIGDGVVAGAGNLISGNTNEGIVVENFGGAVIEANRIGTSIDGGDLGNGSYGVYVYNNFDGGSTRIGGAGSAANEIAFNDQSGIFVPFNGATGLRITRNSIHSNGGAEGAFGLGIDFGGEGVTDNSDDDADLSFQNFPVISSAERLGDETRVSGTLHSAPDGTYEIEFFGNPSCDPTGYGEGRTFLGRISASTGGSGDATFRATVPHRLGEGDVVTATAHRVGTNGNTSEFSACSAAAVPPPALGTRVTVAPVSGTVLVKRPGGGFRRLKAGQSVPVGSTLDTRKGVVRLTSAANRRGRTQTANFDGGVFKTAQKKTTKAFTELKLNGRLVGCAKQSAATSARRRRGRRLWGSGSGRFRSIGSRASAGVRGTKWLVEDRCDGSTLVAVKKGRVTVRDFARGRTITLRAGQRYVARRRRQ